MCFCLVFMCMHVCVNKLAMCLYVMLSCYFKSTDQHLTKVFRWSPATWSRRGRSLSLPPLLLPCSLIYTIMCYVTAASEHLWWLCNCSRIWLWLFIAVWLQQSTRKQRYVHNTMLKAEHTCSSLSLSLSGTHTHPQRSGLLKLLFWSETALPLCLRSTLTSKLKEERNQQPSSTTEIRKQCKLRNFQDTHLIHLQVSIPAGTHPRVFSILVIHVKKHVESLLRIE